MVLKVICGPAALYKIKEGYVKIQLVATYKKSCLRLPVLWIFLSMLLPPQALDASQSVIKSVLRTNKSVVSILAESGAVVPVAAKPFVVQETGEILVAAAYRGIQYNRTGSGIILHPSGLIAANHHVVDQAGRITVTLHNKSSYEAKIVHRAPESDIAILRIQTPYELVPMELADSDAVELSDRVYLIGSSMLIKNTLTEGKITGLGAAKNPSSGKKQHAIIEVNFELHKGDSGSPVLNRYGECLGLVTAGREKQSATYAVPSNIISMHFRNYLSAHPAENL